MVIPAAAGAGGRRAMAEVGEAMRERRKAARDERDDEVSAWLTEVGDRVDRIDHLKPARKPAASALSRRGRLVARKPPSPPPPT